MAYPYYSHNSGFYGTPTPYIPAQAQNPAMSAPSVSPAQNAPSAANNGLQWVQGETGAKSYMAAPNTTVMLMDSEAQKFYLKTVDAWGRPLPLRVFEYVEIKDEPATPPPIPEDKYVTREEFDRKIGELMAAKKAQKKAEVKDDE